MTGGDQFRLTSAGIVPLHYQSALVHDRQRVSAFERAINELVTAKDVVVDVGAGLGLLSLLASRNAKRVYAVEWVPEIAEAGERITRRYSNNLVYLVADSREVNLPEPVDVVICEMIDTALVDELQVQSVNHALRTYAKNGARMIPRESRTYGQLVDYGFQVGSFVFDVPTALWEGLPLATREHSCEFLIDVSDFTSIVEQTVSFERQIRVTQQGRCNAIILWTDIHLCPGVVLRGRDRFYRWFNAPHVIPVTPLHVDKGDIMQLRLSYTKGCGWGSLNAALCKT